MHDTDKRANELAREVFDSARHSLVDAKAQGLRPTSDDPQETHEYVKRAFEVSEGLTSRLQSATDSPSVYEISVVDRDGIVLVSSDPSLPGKPAPRTTAICPARAKSLRAADPYPRRTSSRL